MKTYRKRLFTMPALLSLFALGCDVPDIDANEQEVETVTNNSNSTLNERPSTGCDEACEDLLAAEAASESLAIGLASILSERDLKDRLLRAFAASPHPEGKVLLTVLLENEPAIRQVLERALQQRDLDLAELLAAQVRELEVYIPVEDHRARTAENIPWVVATQIVEEKAPFGVMEDGRTLKLDLVHPPLLPTMVLVPNESFDAQHNLIGDFSAGIKPATLPQFNGLWAVSSDILDLHEPWPRGNPELNVHVLHGSTSKQVACSSEKGYEPYKFDQNGYKYWLPFLVGTPAQLPDDNFVITVYEDDDTDCVIKDGSNALKAAAIVIVSLYNYYTAAMEEDPEAFSVDATALFNALKVLFGGDDDFVGLALGDPNNPITGIARKVWLTNTQGYQAGSFMMRWGYDVAHPG